jgi:hypothetical protein
MAVVAHQPIIKVQAPSQSILYQNSYNPPKIIFNSQQQSSSLKKSSRIISYTPTPQHNIEHRKAPMQFQPQYLPTNFPRP